MQCLWQGMPGEGGPSEPYPDPHWDQQGALIPVQSEGFQTPLLQDLWQEVQEAWGTQQT